MLPETLPRVISVGRLDINSEGLLLLTNNPFFANILELPKNQFIRVYKIRVFGEVNKKKLSTICNGVVIDGIKYNKNIIEIIKSDSKNSWLKISIFEGKNREVRRLMEYIGLKVNRLIRIQYGPYFLDSLPKGQVKEVSVAKEIEKYL
jgi:23S rRNA pseudouridine2605 synthase